MSTTLFSRRVFTQLGASGLVERSKGSVELRGLTHYGFLVLAVRKK